MSELKKCMYREKDSKATKMSSLIRFIRKGLLEGMANEFYCSTYRLSLRRSFPTRHDVYRYDISMSEEVGSELCKFMLENKDLLDDSVRILYQFIGEEMPKDAEPFVQVSIKASSNKYDLGNGVVIKDDGSTIENLDQLYTTNDGTLIVVCGASELAPLAKLSKLGFEPIGWGMYYYKKDSNYIYFSRPNKQLTNYDRNGNFWATMYPIEDEATIAKIYSEYPNIRRCHTINSIIQEDITTTSQIKTM